MIKNRIQNDIVFRDLLKELCQNSKLLESEQHIQHGNTSVLKHSIAVAFFSYHLALKLQISIDAKALIRGALLHDYFLYDWHIKDSSHRLHGFTHPNTALENANRDLELNQIEKDIISKHMFPLTPSVPKYKESIIVCMVDKICSLYETLRLDSIMKLYDYKVRHAGMYEVIMDI